MKFANVLTLCVLLCVTSAFGLEVNRSFSDNMVLQRDKPITVKGTAASAEKITVTFAGKTATAVTDKEGLWSASLDPLPASAKGRDMVVSAKSGKVTLSNVVIGDVFLHARQTAIDISLGKDKAGEKAASSHKKTPLFRAMTVTTIPSAKPLDNLAKDATSGWGIVDKESALTMTASAFYLGRDLINDSEVPIGIIDLNMGPAFANSWLSSESLLDTGKYYDDKEVAGRVAQMEEMLAAELAGEPYGKKKKVVKDVILHPLFPAGGYNAVLQPLAGIGLNAVLLQLGNDYPYGFYKKMFASDDPFNYDEHTRAYDHTYDLRKVGFRMESKIIPRIPREWRTVLGDKELGFAFVLPPASDLDTLAQHHREMRELQRVTAEDAGNVGLIMPGTEHVAFSAQPADEKLLAERMQHWVQGAVLGQEGVPPSGPRFDSFDASFNEAIIHFEKGTAEGLDAKGDALKYFEVANIEGDYYPAEARIDGDSIRLKSDTVMRIMRVRYNWSVQPDQGLVNAAGLPALPFRSERAEYHWFVTNDDVDLPEEYSLPANEWKKNDVTLVNVAALGKHGYDNFTGWIGPAGFRAGPFGPNMEVGEIVPGSPADGTLLEGDVIYSANGNMLGKTPWVVMAAAVTESETHDAGGKLVLGLRRGAENMEVTLTLPVMGTYSTTAPFDCPKTEKILSNLIDWYIQQGAGAGFLNFDAAFMLATGDPELLGYVRRVVYQHMAKVDPDEEIDPLKAGKSWYNSADAFLLGEYYLATGDKNVLPYLKNACDRLAVTQDPIGGWRHNNKPGSSYGMIPNAGLPGVMGMHFATLAGLEIDAKAYKQGLYHFTHGRAETASMIYGNGQHPRYTPPRFDPETMAAGKMTTANGGISAAGILVGFVDNQRAAHLCSAVSTYSFNNTFGGHGGNFWNNFWTPLGANQHSKEAFIHFWKGHRWYRELSRMPDGSLSPGGKVTAAFGMPLVAPRRRIQIVGAPASPFAKSASDVLKPALSAYWSKDYAEAVKRVRSMIADGTVGKADLPTAEFLARAATETLASIEADLVRVHALVDEKKLIEAKSFLAGLAGVMKSDDKRLIGLQKTLADVEEPPKKKGKEPSTTAEDAQEKPREWECLVLDSQSKDLQKIVRSRGGQVVRTKREIPNTWRLLILEDIKQAPEGWMKSGFDDSGWMSTQLPTSWHMYHTAMLRTTFTVDDKNRFDGLRLHSWILRQQNVEVYLNGELIGKINNAGKTTEIETEFKASALKHLKNGDNSLAIKTRHNWRWGRSFMNVYNNGFDFNLDARIKQK